MKISTTNICRIASLLAQGVQCSASPASSWDACASLSWALPGKVSYRNSSAFALSNDYWSARQTDVPPECFAYPESTGDISVMVKLLTSLSASFTVKSGGHTAHLGSNLPGGVTIDLARLSQVKVSADRETTSIGSGARWVQVAATLDPMGLAVVGGRMGDVGVSGLILGGGLSYFSGDRGWACDNVRTYEVVLVSGEVVEATPEQNPDLYWALRGGGGSSFGIVSRFDLVTFPQGDLWSLQQYHPPAVRADLFSAYVDLTVSGLNSDPDAHNFLVFADSPLIGTELAINYMYHATPPATSGAIPPVFAKTAAVSNALINTTLVGNLSAIYASLSGDPNGSRRAWTNVAVHLKEGSEQLLEDVYTITQGHRSRVKALATQTNDTSAWVLFGLHPITTDLLEAMQKNGGNALGLRPEDGPLTLVQINTIWAHSDLDERILASADQAIAEVRTLATERGAMADFIYMNYAAQSQDVFAGYGKANEERLTKVAQKYDPNGTLKKLWKGYFQV
ncbi:hypothetical protein MCOR25_002667 [Pyricularia grisea]|uniref:FAD-binding PCMH-type domain-containing protein n=1 Tax=Pyricularia grisea TaxID=148305 RepID=A0A6P8B9A6_PYRGI|nr:uncharacterized protein PgNI_03292 [Pyricularia grisea]KAI6376702.1 hypothetical protein MCOR25_002667 [Pyricularia grisea]TLD12391.1 hypothetical protein PgNI_03292 [Pyricularia grisea]